MKTYLDNLKNKGYSIIEIENIALFDELKKNLVNKLNIAQVSDKNILTVRKKIDHNNTHVSTNTRNFTIGFL